MAGVYIFKLRPFVPRSLAVSTSFVSRAPTITKESSEQSSDRTRIRRDNVGKIVAGLLLTWGTFKWLKDQRLQGCKLIETISKKLTVNAFSIPVGGSGDSNADSPRAKFNFLADIVEKTAPSVVYIEIRARHPITRNFISISNGSGFIIKPDGLILTNAHVVANQPNVTVKLHDGREFKGVVEDVDTQEDLATVRISAENLPVLKLGQSSDLRPGEFVIALGNPLTLSHTITAGVISSTHRPSKELGLHHKTDYIQTDAAINVGNSGGPLVNLDGEAIGINTMKVTEGISFAIPSDHAIDFLKRSEAKKTKGWNLFGKEKSAETPKKRYIGITMLTLTPQLIQELQQRNSEFPVVQHGVLVWRITIGSPAYEGGIRPGDVITAINGKKVNSAKDIYKFLETSETLNISVVRGRNHFEAVIFPQESIS